MSVLIKNGHFVSTSLVAMQAMSLICPIFLIID